MGCSESKTRQQPQEQEPQQQQPDSHPEASSDPDFEDVENNQCAVAPPPPQEARTFRVSRQLLGKGASASVYVGVCEQDHEPVAVKRVLVRDESVAVALQREYETLKSLPPNDHVVRVFHFECSGHDGIIVMELVKGGTLRRLCQAQPQKRLHENVIRQYLRDTLLGLQHLHRNGIIHRDVKCDNVLVATKISHSDAPNRHASLVKISDFGSCKTTLHGGICQTTVNVVGTVPYMSPESIKGKFSEASDVWAFGITFLELATAGQGVWNHLGVRDQFALLLRIGALTPPNHLPLIPPYLSNEAVGIIRSCLEFNPADRPSCEALASKPYFADLDWKPEGVESIEHYDLSLHGS